MATLKFDPDASVIITEAKIWGRLVTTSRMVFDTGASLVMIPLKLASALGLDINPERTITTTTASAIESAPVVTIPKMSVLGLQVKNVEAIVKDLPGDSGVDGLLGLSFIKHFKVEIDFKLGKLTLKEI